jgi:hypothetical protein
MKSFLVHNINMPASCGKISRWIKAKSLSQVQKNMLVKKLGKIAMLVLKLCSKGQLRPSIFRLTTLVPQLLILGQTHPYAYMGLHINTKLI